MKEVTIYQCGFCGTTYKTSDECSACENKHKGATLSDDTITPALDIYRLIYEPIYKKADGYPTYIDVKDSDGNTVRYIDNNLRTYEVQRN